MLNLLTTFQTDERLESDGAWVPITGGARLRIAREGNPAYARLLSEMAQQYQGRLDGDSDAARRLNREVMGQVIARTILLDWEGVAFEEGVPAPYSQENAQRALQMRDFATLVMRLASDVDNFRVRHEQDQQKN